MSTLELPDKTTVAKTAAAGRAVLACLRTISGLVVLLGAVLFVVFDGDDTGGTTSSEAAALPHRVDIVTVGRAPRISELVFYLVETQTQADLAASEDYENWDASKGGFDRQIHIVFARDSAEESAAYQLILQKIRDAYLPPIVSIFDHRYSDD